MTQPIMNDIDSNVEQVYLHPKQLEYMMISAHTNIMICARRWGKSMIIALTVKRNVEYMPRSTGGFIAQSYRQAHSRTLPALISALEMLGYKRNIHFVVGIRPPKYLGYPSPIVEPNDWKDVVSFYTGAIMVIISQDVPLSSNSMTLDWLIGDEAKGLNYEKLKDEVLPANGGTTRYFGDCPWNHSVLFCSDMPSAKSGFWLFNYQKLYDEKMAKTILQLVAKRYQIANKPINSNNVQLLKRIDRTLNILRKNIVYYQERPIFDNIALVGTDYVKQMKRDLTPLVFQTSILCQRIKNIQGGFYSAFNPKIHTYINNNNNKLQNGWEHLKEYGCELDGDVDLNAPIAIALDYNANINWLVAGQKNGLKLNILKSFYVKYDRKIRELIDDFCYYYRLHKRKDVVFYFDSTAKGNNYAASMHDFSFIVEDQLSKNGWKVESIYLGNPMHHKDKYQLINDCFNGVQSDPFSNYNILMPMLNKENNPELIDTMQLTGLIITSKGLQKDKSGEKKPENENDINSRLEIRTDSTDAFDTLLIGCCLFPYTETYF